MTTSLDTEFYRRFAARVRSTVATTPEGSPTMNDTTTVETTEAAPAVPATFRPAPDTFPSTATGQCTVHPWCTETNLGHLDHIGKSVAFYPAHDEPPVLEAYLYTDTDGIPDLTWNPGYDADDYTSGDQLREQTAKVRAHLARLDAFADQYDAMREAGGEQPSSEPSTRPAPLFYPEGLDEDGLPKGAARITAEADGTGYLLAAHIAPCSDGTLLIGADGHVSADLDADAALRLRNSVAAFLPRLDAMIIAVAQPAPATPVGGTWTITTRGGVDITGYLPSWAEGDPSETDLPAADLGFHLSDLTHDRWFDGQPIAREGGEEQGEMLNVLVRCTPYNPNPELRLPTANVNIADDVASVNDLDPDGVADLAAKLRAQADRLDNEVRPMLIAARADWAANGGTR